MKKLIAGFALWLVVLYALMHAPRVLAGVWFQEPDGGWVEWKNLPDGGVTR